MKIKNNLLTVIDIGTSKIICLIALIDNNDNIKIIGYAHRASKGFRAGSVIDIKLAENTIFDTVEAAEKMAGINISKIIININSTKVESHIIESSINLSGIYIGDKDINKLTDQALEQLSNPTHEIIHYFPLEYVVDNEHNIKDPKLMFSNNLSCKFNIINVASNILLNLFNCFARCHINVENFILSPYAASFACLTDEELERNSILIDIGDSTTSISFIQSGQIIFNDSLMIGGMHITSDIAHSLALSIEDSERIKILYGNAINSYMNDYEVIDVCLGHENEISYIRKKELFDVINARIEEIFELIKINIINSKINLITYRNIVLIGSTSQLPGIGQVASRILNSNVRVAAPKILNGLEEAKNISAFATAIGMVVVAHKNFIKEKYTIRNNKSKYLDYLKKFFNLFQF